MLPIIISLLSSSKHFHFFISVVLRRVRVIYDPCKMVLTLPSNRALTCLITMKFSFPIFFWIATTVPTQFYLWMQLSQGQIPTPIHTAPQSWTSLGGPEIILPKFSGKTNYNVFAIFLIQSASQIEPCQQKTHIQLSVPPHASRSLWKLFSSRQGSTHVNMTPHQQARHWGNMQPFARRELWI